jgi:undecaprenyl-diphosphatase
MSGFLTVGLLALIQGLTEFLPVSSSGHLVVVQHVLGWNRDNVLLDATLHLGTAAAIALVFWNDIRSLVGGLFAGERARRRSSFRMAAFIVLGSIPAGVAGLAFKGFFERMFLDARTTGLLFFVTAAFLFASALRKGKSAPLDAPKVAVVGLAQALAILPGISRSGTTISAALLAGTERKEAGRFAFLLGLPIILGAALLELRGASSTSVSSGLLIEAFAVSFVVGAAALKLLLRVIDRGKLHWFGYYLVALGIACLVFL